MVERERRKLRKRLATLLNTPDADENEIRELTKLLNTKDRKRTGPPRTKVLSVDPVLYVKWRNEGKSVDEIIAILGIERRVFLQDIALLRDRGLIKNGDIKRQPPRRKPDYIPFTKEDYLEMQKTMTDSEIAKKQHCTITHVYHCRKKWGFARRNNQTTLTYKEYKELKKQFRYDAHIERHLGYKPNTITRLKAQKWVMLDEEEDF